MLTLTDFNSK
jgi:hypothetical protein